MGPRLIAQEKLRKIGAKGGDKNKKAAWPRTRAAILSQYIYNSQLVKMHVASFLYIVTSVAFSLASSAAGVDIIFSALSLAPPASLMQD